MLFRKFILRGREWGMRAVWAVVLLSAVLPLRFGMPAVLINIDDAQVFVNRYAAENAAVGDNVPQVSDNAFDAPAAQNASDDVSASPNPSQTNRASVAASFALKLISSAPAILFAVWLVGAAASATSAVCRGLSLSRALSALSYEVTDGGIYDECEVLCTALRIKRRVSVHIIDGAVDVSPFTRGILHPQIYVPQRLCGYSLDERRVRLTLAHELCHIKRGDMAAKLSICAVRSIHWFNPLLRAVLRVMSEDIELGCDAAVMRLMGGNVRPQYLEILIDEASRSCESVGGGLSISLPFRTSARDFILRRYENMKNIKLSIKHLLSVILCCALMLTSSALVMSSCGMNGTAAAAKTADVKLPSYIDDAIRAYYGITDADKLTTAMLEGIYSINIYKSAEYDNEYFTLNEDGSLNLNGITAGHGGLLLDVYVNGSKWGGALERECKKNRFDYQTLRILGYNDENITEEKENKLRKLNAFYTLKDPNNELLTGIGAAEMMTIFPQTADGTAVYIYDPYASPRENALILGILIDSGACEKKFAEDSSLELDALSALPNLKYVIYSDDLTITSCPVDTLIYDTEKQAVIIPEDAPRYIEP